MSYAQEILQFLIALTAFSGIMYVWHQYVSPWRDPNRKLKKRIEDMAKDNQDLERRLQQKIADQVGYDIYVERMNWWNCMYEDKDKEKIMSFEEWKSKNK